MIQSQFSIVSKINRAISASAASIPPVCCRIVHSFEVVPATGCMTTSEVATALGHADLVDSLIDAGALQSDGTPDAAYRDLGLLVDGYERGTGARVTLVTGEGQVWLARRYAPTQAALDQARIPSVR